MANERSPRPSRSSPPPPAGAEPAPDESTALQKASDLDRIRSLSHLLDNAITIPGTDVSFGLDPIIGLLPAGGDIVGTLLSSYIILEAARFRLSAPTLTRMVFNILLETVVGTIPFLGDLFDVGWKANARNVRLIEAHLRSPRASQAADWRFFILLVVLLLGVIALQIVWYALVFRALLNLFGQ